MTCPEFLSKPCSYSTKISENCVLKSCLVYLHASSVSGQFILYIMNVSKFIILVYVFVSNGFNKIFLMEFYYSSVGFTYMKCGTCVFRKPNNCCLCSCSGIAVFSVIFAREPDSLINYSVIF